MRYPFIEKEREQHTVRTLCRVLSVATSGYYAWRRQEGRVREYENIRLLTKIKVIHERSEETYGSPRIYHKLREDGQRCGVNRVARIMRENAIRAKSTKKFKVTTDSDHAMPVAENLLDSQFEVDQANTAWTSDITFVWTREGWIYLAVILDLFSRRIVGWSMDKRMKKSLVIDALMMAIGRRNPQSGLLVHSDRGSQYASHDYQQILKKHGFICSMSRRGNCWDNAPMESFFSTLKRERVYHRKYRSRQEAHADIFNYIECWYNPHRIHSTLGYQSPAQFENQNINPRKAA
jgi:putative transposase